MYWLNRTVWRGLRLGYTSRLVASASLTGNRLNPPMSMRDRDDDSAKYMEDPEECEYLKDAVMEYLGQL